jgi:NAD(P)-dependent dehydrogenase (short-subunit alcohol dehydrogenase family)
LALHAASEHALSRLTESVQAEVAGSDIRLVSIEPGFFAKNIYTDDKQPTITDHSFYAPMVRRVHETIVNRVGGDPAVVRSSIVAAASDPTSPTKSSWAMTPSRGTAANR